MLQIGDKVIVDSGYSFDGEVGVVVSFISDLPIVDVPSFTIDGKDGWALKEDGWKPIGLWTDKLEAEKDLERFLEQGGVTCQYA